jgi:tetratricopeptide (TPR) repeat protein
MPEKTSETISRMAREFYDKALAALDRNNLDYAIEMFMQCLTVEPNFTKARQYLRAAQMKRTESASGLKRMMVAAKTAPLLTRAKVAVGKNPLEAMSLAEQILSEDPKNGQALLILADAAEAAGFPETAVQTLEHYTKLNPRDTRALHKLARLYGAIERWEMARDTYERLLQLNPNDFEAQKGLKDATAHAAMASGGWEEAASYRDVIKDKEQAIALEQQSRVVRAEDVVENLIREKLAKLQQQPDNPVLQRELGRLYAQKNDFDTALRYLEAIHAREAGADPTLEHEIADIKVKRLEHQIAAKKNQLATNPANAAALEAEIAALEQQITKLRLAETERLVERYPNDLMYRYELGVLYMKTGNIQGAIEQFQKAVGQPQRRIASLNYLGQCFQQLGLYDLAVDQYSKAIAELPMMDNLKKEILYNLASTYEALGEHDKAVAEYKKIAAVDFGYRDVREKITRKPPQTPS